MSNKLKMQQGTHSQYLHNCCIVRNGNAM